MIAVYGSQKKKPKKQNKLIKVVERLVDGGEA